MLATLPIYTSRGPGIRSRAARPGLKARHTRCAPSFAKVNTKSFGDLLYIKQCANSRLKGFALSHPVQTISGGQQLGPRDPDKHASTCCAIDHLLKEQLGLASRSLVGQVEVKQTGITY